MRMNFALLSVDHSKKSGDNGDIGDTQYPRAFQRPQQPQNSGDNGGQNFGGSLKNRICPQCPPSVPRLGDASNPCQY
jgi:hypothetical protein